MANSQTRAMIGQTRDYLWQSKLPESEKDAHQVQLNAADAAIEADHSVICDLLAQRVCADVKTAIRLPDAIRAVVVAEVAFHAATCQAKPAGKLGVLLQLTKSWPLAAVIVAAFAFPNAPSIIQTLIAIFK